MKYTSLILCFFLMGTVVSCKTEEQKAQEQSESLTDQQNRLVEKIRAMGTPNTSWSDEDLDSYGVLLDRLESVENQLENYDGTHGITITGGDNDNVIAVLRSRLETVRTLKADAAKRAKKVVEVPQP